MKKFSLIQFCFSFLIISVLQVSTATCASLPSGYLNSIIGLTSQGDDFANTYGFLSLNNPYQLSPGMFYEQEVFGLDETIASMLSSSDPEVVAEGQHLQSLVYDLHPTIYVRNGNLTLPAGNIPECIDSDASSVWTLYEDNPQFNQVELITIRIEQESDLATVLNLDGLQAFTNLKYVYFMCTFEICSSPGCEATMISQMVQGTGNPDLLILYKISIPE